MMDNTMQEYRQGTFNPLNYGFEWTDDGWYSWDRKACQGAALKARNMAARKLRKQGWTVRCWTHKGLARCGGIGTGKPDIELWVSWYGFDASRPMSPEAAAESIRLQEIRRQRLGY